MATKRIVKLVKKEKPNNYRKLCFISVIGLGIFLAISASMVTRVKKITQNSASIELELHSSKQNSTLEMNNSTAVVKSLTPLRTSLKYWGLGNDMQNPNRYDDLRSMSRVFKRLGYERVNALNGDDWDILWTIEYPFYHEHKRLEMFKPVSSPLKRHQRVNHFPGIGCITSKPIMNTSNRGNKNILQGFLFPQQINEFKAFVKANPSTRFVEKLHANRGIKLVEHHEINFNRSSKFYQVFMEKPFLVEDRFIDFSVFFLLSSVAPLRLYRFTQGMHLRFCPENYYPFDPKNLQKYVIASDHVLMVEMPTLKRYYENCGFSPKLAIEEYFRQKGKNVTELWRKIDETVVQLFLNNERLIVQEVSLTTQDQILAYFTQHCRP